MVNPGCPPHPHSHAARKRPHFGFVTGLVLIMLAAGTVSLSACTTRLGGKQTLEQANDALRAENAALKANAAKLEARNAELDAVIKASTSSSVADWTSASEVLLATPVVTSVEIDRLSGAKGSQPKTFTVYVRTLDGLRRFTQAVGKLSVELRNSKSDAPLHSRVLLPMQLRDAYRSGFAGTGYVVTFPLEEAQKAAEIDMIRATFTDARTGQSVSGELVLEKSVSQPPSRP